MAERFRLDQAAGLPDNFKLPISLDLADINRFESMVIDGMHLFRAARSFELHAQHGLGHLVHVKALGLFARRLPHINAVIRGFDRIICDPGPAAW